MTFKKTPLLLLISAVFHQNGAFLASLVSDLNDNPIAAITIITVVAIWAIRDIALAA